MDNRTSADVEKSYRLVNDDEMESGQMIKCHIHTVEIADGVRRIPAFAFRDAKIHTVIIPPSVQVISASAFKNSTVREILVRKHGSPNYDIRYDNVRRIGSSAFKGCRHLKHFEPRGRLNYIGVSSFEKVPNAKQNLVHYSNSCEVCPGAFGLHNRNCFL